MSRPFPRRSARDRKPGSSFRQIPGPVSAPLTVHYQMGGSAVVRRDYTLNGVFGEATIPAGASSTTVVLHALRHGKKGAVMILLDDPHYAVFDVHRRTKVTIR